MGRDLSAGIVAELMEDQTVNDREWPISGDAVALHRWVTAGLAGIVDWESMGDVD